MAVAVMGSAAGFFWVAATPVKGTALHANSTPTRKHWDTPRSGIVFSGNEVPSLVRVRGFSATALLTSWGGLLCLGAELRLAGCLAAPSPCPLEARGSPCVPTTLSDCTHCQRSRRAKAGHSKDMAFAQLSGASRHGEPMGAQWAHTSNSHGDLGPRCDDGSWNSKRETPLCESEWVWEVGGGNRSDAPSPVRGPQRLHSPAVAMRLRLPPRVLNLRQKCARFPIAKRLLSGVANVFFHI